ncbi:unnamed protein product, partial [Bubo scandiacus]
ETSTVSSATNGGAVWQTGAERDPGHGQELCDSLERWAGPSAVFHIALLYEEKKIPRQDALTIIPPSTPSLEACPSCLMQPQ